jgi:ubiquinone/menaquinone biosynthesis C-methylase UbiE/DNA-binding HxlR family transcriptional regulator
MESLLVEALVAARVFKCLSEGIRLRLIRLLAAEELNGSELRQILDVPQSTLSRHLNVLKESGLVQSRREGNHSFFYLDHQPRLNGSTEDLLKIVNDLTKDDAELAEDAVKLSEILEERRRQVLEHFEAAGETWDEFQVQHADHVVKHRALNRLIPQDQVLVDAGCGSGYLLPELAAAHGQVIAVDNSAAQLERARSKCQREELRNVEFRRGELEKLPLTDGEASGVFAHLTLHHTPSPELAVREMTRVLKPGGTLVITDFLPHEETWLRDEHADLWLGFEAHVVAGWMRSAGLTTITEEQQPYATKVDGKNVDIADKLRLFILSGKLPLVPERMFD